MAAPKYKYGVKQGRAIYGHRTYVGSSAGIKVPLLALIINKTRGKRGEKGLFGDAMRDAVNKLYAARIKSIGFIKSGWIPAIRAFARFSKYANHSITLKKDDAAKIKGQKKGGAVIAKARDIKPSAIFWNSAGGDEKHRGALLKYAGDALTRAFEKETASMNEYIARKLKEGARRINIKTN